jgi:hypothetical protein
MFHPESIVVGIAFFGYKGLGGVLNLNLGHPPYFQEPYLTGIDGLPLCQKQATAGIPDILT